LFKSVDRYLKYQYINTFLFPSAAVRRYQKRNCGQSIQQAFSIGDACFIYIKKL
jgi:predicted RNA-binding protein with PUA-like domain